MSRERGNLSWRRELACKAPADVKDRIPAPQFSNLM